MKIRRFLLSAMSALLFLSGCGEMWNFKSVNEINEIHLTYDEVLEGYFPYEEEEIPDFTCHLPEGVDHINAAKGIGRRFECVLTQNDDFMISDMIKGIIDEYIGKEFRFSHRIVSKDKADETWMNSRLEGKEEKNYIKVKDKTIYNEIAYITLENGLQLTMNYARFTDGETGKTYYRWQKTESIRLVLHYPLMAVDLEGERKFLLLPLPNQVILKFDTTTKRIDDLLSKDKFKEEEYRTYEYPKGYEKDNDNFISYYMKCHGGTVNEDGSCDFVYLGYRFRYLPVDVKIDIPSGCGKKKTKTEKQFRIDFLGKEK